MQGFLAPKKNVPKEQTKWMHLKDFEIVGRFNWKIMGLFNYYYNLSDTKSNLNYIHYILFYSCLFTLAAKFKKRIPKFFNNGRVQIKFDARYQTTFPFVRFNKDQREKYKNAIQEKKAGRKIDWNQLQITKSIELVPYKKANKILANKLKEKIKNKEYIFIRPRNSNSKNC